MAMIEMDYADSLRKASQLESLARELRKIATNDIENIQANINGAWQGSAAEMYKRRVNTFEQDVQAYFEGNDGLYFDYKKLVADYVCFEIPYQNTDMASVALGILGVKSVTESLLYSQPYLLRVGKNAYAFVADTFMLIVSLPICLALDKRAGQFFPWLGA